MANPYAGTANEEAWDQGYSYGYHYGAADTPAGYTPEQAGVFREGLDAGVYQAEQDAHPGTATIAPVTIVGDPNAPADANSGDDAYAAGYTEGYYLKQYNDEPFSDAVKPRYHDGWAQGRAQAELEGKKEGSSLAGEVGETAASHAAPEVISHALHLGPLGLFLGSVLGGNDTILPDAPVFVPLCYRSDHGLNGNAVTDAGAWCGTATLDYAGAQGEGSSHASQWGHTDNAVHTWMYFKESWDPVGD